MSIMRRTGLRAGFPAGPAEPHPESGGRPILAQVLGKVHKQRHHQLHGQALPVSGAVLPLQQVARYHPGVVDQEGKEHQQYPDRFVAAGRLGPYLLVAPVPGFYPPALPVQARRTGPDPPRRHGPGRWWQTRGRPALSPGDGLHHHPSHRVSTSAMSRAFLVGRMTSVNPSTRLGEDDIIVCQETAAPAAGPVFPDGLNHAARPGGRHQEPDTPGR